MAKINRKSKPKPKFGHETEHEVSVDTVFLKDYLMNKACHTVIGDKFFSIDI